MAPDQRAQPGEFADVFLVLEPEPTITYRSGMVAYQESLCRGQFVGRNWSGSGYVNPEAERFDPAKHPAPQAFWVEVDGHLLHAHWQWSGYRQVDDARGLHTVVELSHAIRPVLIRVHTLLDGTSILTRWLEIMNISAQPAALAAAYPWSGVLQTTARAADTAESPYAIGYMIDTHWGNEGDFDWRPLPYAGYRVDGRYRRDRHRHPFFVVDNRQTGEHWIGTLAWSGGFAFEFDVDDGNERGTSRLSFRAGPDAPAPLRVIAPGETVRTPEMHLGMLIADLDACVQALHDHVRASVIAPQPAGRAGLVESGIGPEEEMTPELTMHAIDVAAQLGAELFFIDASWYSAPQSDWWNTVGDWTVGSRYPDGLAPFRERIHGHGMLWGLWMDAERIGAKSKVAQEHPEWLVRRYDDQPTPGGMLDLTVPAAARWMEDEIERLIVEHQLDFFRLDYNIGNVGPAGYTMQAGYAENDYWRYYEALYSIYERLRARHPDVIFENCASGGARTDLGMIRFFNHTWITDWQIAPRSFSITNGMTLALPPERVDRLLLGQWGQRSAELDFQARLLLFVHPTVGWSHPPGAAPNPIQQARIRHMIELHKRFVRPFHASSRIYHHTPVVAGSRSHGWGVLELAARDGTRALAGLFRLSDPAEPDYLLRFRGLDLARRYEVTFDNSGQRCVLDGFTLARTGIPVHLETALTSELLLVEAVD